ncbi:MAG: DUF3024 domain-containing protein [Proteobacteria bacterium]|nr:DUF3024 domain-containing protein [Pseudomonadota bacterium]
MALPEQIQNVVEAKLGVYCFKKVPANMRKEVRLTFSVLGSTVTLFEERPVQNNLDKRSKLPLAQFRLNVVDHLWRLYFARPNRQEGWALYPDVEPTSDFEALLLALDQDRSGVFWG